jgi:hypothetical protein
MLGGFISATSYGYVYAVHSLIYRKPTNTRQMATASSITEIKSEAELNHFFYLNELQILFNNYHEVY